MDIGASCFLCGIRVSRVNSIGPPWTQRFRVLYIDSNYPDHVRISDQTHCGDHETTIPLDPSLQVDTEALSEHGSSVTSVRVKIATVVESQERRLPLQQQGQPETPLRGYVIHSACWDILHCNDSRFKLEDGCDQAILQALFELCRTQEIHNGLLNWGHTYGGTFIGEFPHPALSSSDELPPRRNSLGEENPNGGVGPPYMWMRNPATKVEERTAVHPVALNSATVTSKDLFTKLPVETLIDLCLHLSPESFANLRLASRAVAAMEIPAAFWRSFFSHGGQFDYLRVYIPDGSVSWRGSYRTARRCQNHLSVRNRKRIWDLATFISELVDVRIASKPCERLSVETRLAPREIPRPERERRYLQETLTFPDRWILLFSFHKDSAILSPHITEISATTINIAGKTFISGLGFKLVDGDPIRIGYHRPDQETTFRWENGTSFLSGSLLGFHVAFDGRGIRGLSALCSPGGASSWIGDQEGPGVSRETNVRQNDCGSTPPVRTIGVHLDALRLFNLSLTFHEPGIGPRRLAASVPTLSDLRLPELQPPALTLLGGEYNFRDGMDRRSSLHLWHHRLPYSKCLFGGVNGERLVHLRRVTVWATRRGSWGVYETMGIRAIEFQYERPVGGTDTTVLGAIPQGNQDPTAKPSSFTLDLKDTERIVAFDTVSEFAGNFYRGSSLDSLIIYTSHGQHIELPPRHPRSKKPMIKRLQPEGEGTIVGLFCMMDFGTSIKSLGVIARE